MIIFVQFWVVLSEFSNQITDFVGQYAYSCHDGGLTYIWDGIPAHLITFILSREVLEYKVCWFYRWEKPADWCHLNMLAHSTSVRSDKHALRTNSVETGGAPKRDDKVCRSGDQRKSLWALRKQKGSMHLASPPSTITPMPSCLSSTQHTSPHRHRSIIRSE